MVVWVRTDHRTEFSAMRLFFGQSGDWVLKVGIRAGVGAGLLENACWTLLWSIFGPCMMGFEIGFDSMAAVRNW